MKNFYLLVIFLLGSIDYSMGGGIEGKVLDQEGQPLPFATIYIAQNNFGTTSNVNGDFKIELDPGQYELLFRYVGYESQVIRVEVGEDFISREVRLKTQTVTLDEVEIYGKEDPAYTIMRKAIAKAKYHKMQASSYDCQVYIKGSGRLLKAPFFARKQLAKEGIDSSNVYTSESVSRVHFEQPDKLEETVISVRASGEDAPMSPNLYFFTSFYEPKIGEAISPLSPRAFAYYKFEYMGIFEDQGLFVNEIKVTPRVRGENVFSGKIFIVNDYWNIHSLALETRVFGIDIKIDQVYTSVLGSIWMPVSHKLDVFGKMLGFSGEYQYLAVVSDYKVVPNKELQGEINLIDEKIEEVVTQDQAELTGDLDEDLAEVFETDKAVSRKQFRKMMRQMEKEELQESDEPEVVSQREFKVDSLAKKYDSTYWQKVRPVPLTDLEIKGYQRDDSLYVVNRDKEELDSLGKRGGNFKPWDLLSGNYYKWGERGRFRLMPVWSQSGFNTVDGVNLGLTGTFSIKDDSLNRLRISPEFRYAISRERVNWRVRAARNISQSVRGYLEFGDMVEQFNDKRPIEPLINTFYSVLSRKNYAKLYERKYLKIRLNGARDKRVSWEAALLSARRKQLFNNSNWSLRKESEGRTHTANLPSNIESSDLSFDPNTSTEVRIGLRFRPWLRYQKFNGNKQVVSESAATFGLNYTTAVNAFGGDTKFSRLEATFRHSFALGARARIDLGLAAGKFLNADRLYFMDFKHFDGNRTSLTAANPVHSYRLLDYYSFSTKDKYLDFHSQVQFRKLFLTQILEVRFMGLKENIFFNYLATPELGNYMEVGYGLDNILRFFRVEFATSFVNGSYQENGFRLGVSSFIGRNVQVSVQ